MPLQHDEKQGRLKHKLTIICTRQFPGTTTTIKVFIAGYMF